MVYESFGVKGYANEAPTQSRCEKRGIHDRRRSFTTEQAASVQST